MNLSYSKTTRVNETRKEKARKRRSANVEKQDVNLQVKFNDNTLLPLLFGEHNIHLSRIENKLDVALNTRGNTLTISGLEEQVKMAHKVITNLYAQAEKGRELDFPDVDIEFTYIGRYYKDYQPSATKIIEPTHGIDLGNKLNEHDIYITASRFEPCGMHHVEGSASGLPVIFHKDGGGINELCRNHGESFGTFDEFLVALEKIKSNMAFYKEKIDYKYLSMTRCVDSYINVIETMK